MAPNSKQEPRFALPDSTPRSSKTIVLVSGIKCYVYGLDEIVQSSIASESKPEVACLFLAHGRTRTYLTTEAVAHEVLWRYRNGIVGFDGEKEKPGRIPLIAATFDMRNHGEREVRVCRRLPCLELPWSRELTKYPGQQEGKQDVDRWK